MGYGGEKGRVKGHRGKVGGGQVGGRFSKGRRSNEGSGRDAKKNVGSGS